MWCQYATTCEGHSEAVTSFPRSSIMVTDRWHIHSYYVGVGQYEGICS